MKLNDNNDGKITMNRIAFIVPYFGKFNNYFQLYLNSCRYNADKFDWLIFTDDRTVYDYPENVKVKYCEFNWMKDKIYQKFDFDVKIETPYKLCDYRPAYGYIFEDYLAEYSHWGYCDVDLIFGMLSHFVTDEMLETYDKIFNLGHCTIYRNTYDNNRMFLKELNGRKRYRVVYSLERNCSFDEEYKESVNNIFLEYGKNIFEESFAANVYTKSSDFKIISMNSKDKSYSVEKKKKAIFIWSRGILIRKELKHAEIIENEYMYIHMQSRPMKVNIDTDSYEYKIIPNSFDSLEIPAQSIDNVSFSKICIKHPNLHYFKLRFKNLMIKGKRTLEEVRSLLLDGTRD